MQDFMAIFIATPASRAASGWAGLDADAQKSRQAEGVQAWDAWVEKHRQVITDSGSPLGKTKRTDAAGVTDGTNAITAYTIVRAETHEAAARLFENHPHFTVFQGEAVEIMPCLPIPGR